MNLDSVDQFNGSTGSKKFRMVSGSELSLVPNLVLPVPQAKPIILSPSDAEIIRRVIEQMFFGRLNQKTITYVEPKLLTYVSAPGITPKN